MDIAVENDTQGGRILVAYSRAYSAQDHDVYAYVCGRDFEWPVKVLSTVDPANDDRDACAAYVAGAGRWIVAFSRAKWSGGSVVDRNIRVCFHDRTSTTLNGGPAVDIPRIQAEHFAHPDLGGTYDGDRGLLVYERTAGAPAAASAEVVAVPIDAGNAQLLSAWHVGAAPAGSGLERRRPGVNQVGGSYGWLVAWQERSLTVPGDDWDIEADAHGPARRQARVGAARERRDEPCARPARGRRLRQDARRVRPLDGPGVRRRAAHRRAQARLGARAAGAGARDRAHGHDHRGRPELGRPGVSGRGPRHALALGAGLHAEQPCSGRRAHVVRLGRTGGITESQALPLSPTATSAFAPAITYDAATGRFPSAYSTDATFSVTRYPVIGTCFTYPPDAMTLVYGAACGTALIRATDPYAGHAGFVVYMVGAPASTPAVLVLGPNPTQQPLDAIGMPGCALLLDPVVSQNLVTSGGVGQVPLPLPDTGTLAVDLRSQFFYLQAGANALGVVGTSGLLARVR
jgi:hypothetical protein